MLAQIIYSLATLSIATLGGVYADDNTAWLYSGNNETCNTEAWVWSKGPDEGRNMDSQDCIKDQPVGNDRRRRIWFPNLKDKGFWEKDERNFCLIMKKANNCDGTGKAGDWCMDYDDTLDITLNATSENCTALPGAGDDDGGHSYQAFKFMHDQDCEKWKNDCNSFQN